MTTPYLFQRLKAAVSYHEQGDFTQAERIYQEIIAEDERCADAWNLLGAIYLQQGEPMRAFTLIQNALTLNNQVPSFLNNYGAALQAMNRFSEAEDAYRQAIKLAPFDVDARKNSAALLRLQGKLKEAKEELVLGLRFCPEHPVLKMEYAQTLTDMRCYADALRVYDALLEQNPEHSHLLFLRAMVLWYLDRADEALSILQYCREQTPDNVLVLHALSQVYYALNDYDTALNMATQAVLQAPSFPEAWSAQGHAYYALNHLAEARRCYEQALEINPSLLDAMASLTAILWETHAFDEGLLYCDRALQMVPGSVVFMKYKGLILQAKGELKTAEEVFRRALRYRPEWIEVKAHLITTRYQQALTRKADRNFDDLIQHLPSFQDLYMIHDIQKIASRTSQLEAMILVDDEDQSHQGKYEQIKQLLTLPILVSSSEEIEQLRQQLHHQLDRLLTDTSLRVACDDLFGQTTAALAYYGENELHLQKKIAQLHQQICPELLWTASHCQEKVAAKEQLKIGICSARFYASSVGRLYTGLLEHLPKASFEVILFSLPGKVDSYLQQQIDSVADRVIRLPKQLEMVRERIARERLDILFYPDIGVDALGYYLAFARLAPVQCTSFAHPLTSGLDTIDHFISSKWLEPDHAERFYHEKLTLLPTPPATYTRPRVPFKANRMMFDQLKTLSASAHIYFCPQDIFKLHPQFDAVFREILYRDPEGYLLFRIAEKPRWQRFIQHRLAQNDPSLMDRIVFISAGSEEQFKTLVMVSDVVLDAHPVSGNHRSLDTLACGVPLVTLPGENMASRITQMLCRIIEVPECIAEDAEDYVERALRLTHDYGWRKRVSEKIIANCDKLCQPKRAAQAFGLFFQHAYQEIQE
ncbi:tetratricopeptide repeat protein [Magnetococcales bacterium HHB-1]